MLCAGFIACIHTSVVNMYIHYTVYTYGIMHPIFSAQLCLCDCCKHAMKNAAYNADRASKLFSRVRDSRKDNESRPIPQQVYYRFLKLHCKMCKKKGHIRLQRRIMQPSYFLVSSLVDAFPEKSFIKRMLQAYNMTMTLFNLLQLLTFCKQLCIYRQSS